MFTIVVDAAGVGERIPATGFQGKMGRDRLLEGTDARLRARLNALGEEDLERSLVACPVLWCPEHSPNDPEEALAHVGRFDRLRVDEREVHYTFKPYEGFEAIPVHRLQEMDDFFRFGEWGWHRTKMVVMEDDVFDVLGPDVIASRVAAATDPNVPSLFNIEPKSHDKLVCVMMPFTLVQLEPVFAKIDRELARIGIACERADTDLSARRIIDKVATLIYNADAVVCDFTGTNPNVFYEAGLAHAWSKRTIFIAERGTILPFDTRDEATIIYDNTNLGLKNLWYQILDRLRAQTELLAPQ